MSFGTTHGFIVAVLICELCRTAWIMSKCIGESSIPKGVGQLIAAIFEGYFVVWALHLLGAI